MQGRVEADFRIAFILFVPINWQWGIILIKGEG